MSTLDRIPLWICKRYYKGVWKPELRLYNTLFAILLCPIGLGISGAGLEYHLHYMVYTLGIFFQAIGNLITVPIAVNYVAESFMQYGAEATLIMSFYRTIWGVVVPFFAMRWIDAVGVGWVYGMAAFFTIVSWGLIALLLWQGPRLRRMTLMKGMVLSEEGTKIFDS